MSSTEEGNATGVKEKKKSKGKKDAEAKSNDTQKPAAEEISAPKEPEKPENEKVEKVANEKTEPEKPSLTDEKTEELSFSELLKQNVFRELMNEAKKKSKELKLNILAQLNEVFKLFDIDRDGVINETDLKFTFSSLGELNVSEEKIKNMLSESPNPIDFNTFVGLFESKEMEFDPEFDLIAAFSKWDSRSNGLIIEENLRNALMRGGDRFSEKDADRALEEAPIYGEGEEASIDYVEFCANICGLQNVRGSDLYQERYSSSIKK